MTPLITKLYLFTRYINFNIFTVFCFFSTMHFIFVLIFRYIFAQVYNICHIFFNSVVERLLAKKNFNPAPLLLVAVHGTTIVSFRMNKPLKTSSFLNFCMHLHLIWITLFYIFSLKTDFKLYSC